MFEIKNRKISAQNIFEHRIQKFEMIIIIVVPAQFTSGLT